MSVAELQATIAKLQTELKSAQEEIKEKDKELRGLAEQNKALTQHIKALSDKQPNSGSAEQAGVTESGEVLASKNKLLQTSLDDKVSILQSWMENAKAWESIFAKLAGENTNG